MRNKVRTPDVVAETSSTALVGTGQLSFGERIASSTTARAAGISAALLVPVFWHLRIEAGDLASHLYNAWLAQLIRQGQAPGLWIGRQWNNVLFDLLLSRLGSAFGLHAAERIAVSLAVLTFFWGAFVLIGAATRRLPWKFCPLLAVFAYGWTFEMGFMNYYISLGLCFFALAAFLRGGRIARLLGLVLVPLIWMAHPLGVLCLAGLGGYLAVAKAVRPRYHAYVLVGAGICLFGVRMFLVRRYQVKWTDWGRYFFYNGADQLALYSSRYYWIYALFVLLMIVALASDLRSQQVAGGFWHDCGVPLQLYVAAGAASVLLPSIVYLPQYALPVSYLTARLSSVLGIVACWMLGAMKPRRWHAIACAAIAVLFFSLLYVDTRALNGMEEQVERLVAALPAGSRVVEDIESADDSRMVIEHIVDRACIGRCFSYDNYEAATGQFRLHAAAGNSIVRVDAPESVAASVDEFVKVDELVKALLPPVFEVFQCEGSGARICLRELSEDEMRELVLGTFEE